MGAGRSTGPCRRCDWSVKSTRLRICAAKRRYPTQEQAQAAVEQATIILRPYRCDRCGQFHLTRRTKGKRIARPAG